VILPDVAVEGHRQFRLKHIVSFAWLGSLSRTGQGVYRAALVIDIPCNEPSQARLKRFNSIILRNGAGPRKR